MYYIQLPNAKCNQIFSELKHTDVQSDMIYQMRPFYALPAKNSERDPLQKTGLEFWYTVQQEKHKTEPSPWHTLIAVGHLQRTAEHHMVVCRFLQRENFLRSASVSCLVFCDKLLPV